MIIMLLAWLLADLFSGLVHWYEDRAMADGSHFKCINGIRADNERHHKIPGYLVRLSYWANISTTAPFAWGLALALVFWEAPPLMSLTVFFMGFGNLVHRWAHENPARLPFPVRLLQKTGLFISPEHHAKHHYLDGKLVSRENSRLRFCVMTSWLNPILDGVGFFKKLDCLIRRNK